VTETDVIFEVTLLCYKQLKSHTAKSEYVL